MLRTLLLLLLPFSLLAQDRGFWQKANPSDAIQNDIINYATEVEDVLYYDLDKVALSNYLEQAPDRYQESNSSTAIELPNPSGGFDTFKIYSTQTMARDLADKFPKVKSYIGYNQANKSHTARITITPTGIYIMTLGSDFGQTFINPYAKNSNIHFVFDNQSSLSEHTQICEVDDEHLVEFIQSQYVPYFIDEGNLRKYKLAVATTVEYSDFHWQEAGVQPTDSETDKKAAVQAAIVVTIDRVNQMFERDFGVTLELVANNDDVIFLGDPSDDPYDNTSHSQMIDENQLVLDAEIGSENYDIGHVFNTNGGGLASTPSVCNDSFKAKGSTGLPNPVGDPFDISIASHEFGHQFGANHTQNNDVNRNDDTAVETGSGTTIMGYAGSAPPNVQNNTDAMFHYISISEVSNLFGGLNGSCAEIITIANEAPVVEPISNFTVPQNTPFMLEADATDADGDDLTYSWEQLDNEIAVMPPESTSANGPAFRTLLPSSNPTRHFPSMNTLLENNYSNTWEVLATVNRSYNFGVVVRDNNLLGGQVATQTTTITVDDAAGPFRMTSQHELEEPWQANDTKTITWDVANTNDPTGIDAQNVDILLSIDGGETFSEILLENTPNDGEENIVVPDIITSNARIMVKASDNIFFDINNQAFSIGTAFTPEYCEAGSDDQNFTNISRVEFNTIDNTSGNDSYSDFTSIHTSVQRGESYDLSVHSSGGTVYDSDQVIVWIDFNQNGSFDDPGEKVIETDKFDGDWAIYPFGGAISIPSNARLGETTMRIRKNNADFGTSNTTPCGISTFGEVEDYRIVIYDDFLYYEEEWLPQNPTGISTDQDNILMVNGETSFSGITEAKDLTVQISSKLNVSGVLKVDGDIQNNGDLVFLSNDSNTGQLDSFSGSISRPVEVQRHIPNKRAFRFLSSPVGGVNIADAWQQQIHITGNSGTTNGFDETASNNPSMFSYDHDVEDQNQPWVAIPTTNQNLEAGKPYRVFVRGSRTSVDLSNNESPSSEVTLNAKGNLHVGNFSVETSNFENNYTFIGNPYQSIVNLENLVYGDGVNTNYAYYWDPKLSDHGGFVVIDIPESAPNPSSSDANKFLRPGQAVFMKNNNTGSNYNIAFNEASKATSGSATQVFNDTQLAYLNMRVYTQEKFNTDQTEEDALGLRFKANGNSGIDDSDAPKKGHGGVNLATINNNALWSVEYRNIPDQEDIIPIFMNNTTAENYVFWLDLQTFNQIDKLFLKDNYLDTQTELEQGINEIEFSVDQSISDSSSSFRFELIIDNVSLSTEDFLETSYQLYPNPTTNGSFTAQSPAFTNSELEIKIYNILGQKMFETKTIGSDTGKIYINTENLSTSTYLVKIENKEGEIIKDKLIVK